MVIFSPRSFLVMRPEMVTFFLSIVAGLSEDLEFLRYFSPFKYFDPGVLLRQSQIDINFVLLSVGIVAVLMVGAYVSYSKRDLYI